MTEVLNVYLWLCSKIHCRVENL